MPKPKTGRPFKMPRYDWDTHLKEIEDWAAGGASDQEIAVMLGYPADSLVRNCTPQLERGRARLKMQLREAQIKMATEGRGNALMGIFLGKQILGQVDRTESFLTTLHANATPASVTGALHRVFGTHKAKRLPNSPKSAIILELPQSTDIDKPKTEPIQEQGVDKPILNKDTGTDKTE